MKIQSDTNKPNINNNKRQERDTRNKKVIKERKKEAIIGRKRSHARVREKENQPSDYGAHKGRL
jgi:hypothetical protein